MNLIDYSELKTHFKSPDEKVTQIFVDSGEQYGFTKHCIKICYDDGGMIPEWLLITSLEPLTVIKGGWMFGIISPNYPMVDYGNEKFEYEKCINYVTGLTLNDILNLIKIAEPYKGKT